MHHALSKIKHGKSLHGQVCQTSTGDHSIWGTMYLVALKLYWPPDGNLKLMNTIQNCLESYSMSDEVKYQLGLGPEYIYFQFPILRITWFAESVSHLLLISMMDKFVFILDTIPFVWTLGFHIGRLIVFKQLSSECTYLLARYIYKTIFNKHCLLPLYNTHTYSSSKQPNNDEAGFHERINFSESKHQPFKSSCQRDLTAAPGACSTHCKANRKSSWFWYAALGRMTLLLLKIAVIPTLKKV